MEETTTFKSYLAPACISLLAFLFAWQFLTLVSGVSQLILPGPWPVGKAMLANARYLTINSLITIGEAAAGFLLGTFAALALAVLFQFSRFVERAIYPYAIALKAIPLVALAPIVIVWFGPGVMSKVVLAAVISFFPVLVNAIYGFRAVPREAMDLFLSLSATPWETLVKLQFPAALPSIFAALKVSATFSVVGAVVAEFVGAQSGIGYVVKAASYYLDSALMFAGVIAAGCSSLIFYGVVVFVEAHVVPWRSKDQG